MKCFPQTNIYETCIDSFNKECATYPEHKTSCFENVANIVVNKNSVITQEKQNGGKEDNQEYRKISMTKKKQIIV